MKELYAQRIRAAAAEVVRSRGLRLVVVITALYLLLDLAMSCEMKERGLLSPGGSLHVDAIVVGAVCLVARVAVRFGLPALLAGSLVRLVIRGATRSSPGPRRAGVVVPRRDSRDPAKDHLL
jgi:hypothetical protein